MIVKKRVRALLKDLLLSPSQSKVERVSNVIDPKLGSQKDHDEQFGFIRVLARNTNDANRIADRLKEHKTELGISSVLNVVDTLGYKSRKGVRPDYTCSVLAKVEPELLMKSAFESMTNEGIEKLKNQLNTEDNGNSTNKRVLIDYSSPNIAKPFHFGHLKSTILGNYLANLNKFIGNKVIRLNYIGDWGTQYGLLGLGLDKFDRLVNESDIEGLEPVAEVDLNNSDDPEATLRKLLRVYAAANELGRKDETFFREAGEIFETIGKDVDSDHHKRWIKIRSLSLEELKQAYRSLNIEFDEFEYESDFANSTNFIQILSEKGLLNEHADGFTSVDVAINSKPYEAPLLKSDGSSLYLCRDIAAALSRKEKYNFDEMFYVAGLEQQKHFNSLRAVIRLLGHESLANSCTHVRTGRVIGLSSRSGKCDLLSDIIRDAREKYIDITKRLATSKVARDQSIELLQRVGHNLALSALFVFDMKLPRKLNYDLNWDEVFAPSSSSGINLQATYARLCSLREKACQAFNLQADQADKLLERNDLNVDAICCVEGMNVVSVLSDLDEALNLSRILMEPRPLVLHAFKLSSTINRARRCDRLNVINEQNEIHAITRLALFMSARQQLEMIIRLIGLEPLEKV